MNFGLLHSIATACLNRNLHPGYLKKPCYICIYITCTCSFKHIQSPERPKTKPERNFH